MGVRSFITVFLCLASFIVLLFLLIGKLGNANKLQVKSVEYGCFMGALEMLDDYDLGTTQNHQKAIDYCERLAKKVDESH